jgi:hypothetical protein
MLSDMCTGLHVKQRIFWDFNGIWILSRDIQISLLLKSCQRELICCNRTDRHDEGNSSC